MNHEAHIPNEAKEGPWQLGAMIMVSRDALAEDYRLPGLAPWFPAQVCMPTPGNEYRWYDPYVHYETDGPLHSATGKDPANKSYVGKLWYQPSEPDSDWYDARSFWAYPIAVWRELFADPRPVDSP